MIKSPLKTTIILLACLLALAYIGAYLSHAQVQNTELAGLAGRWAGKYNHTQITLDIESTGLCALRIAGDGKAGDYYSGKCVIGRDKAPVTLTIYDLPAHDFNLHTIIASLDDNRMLMAPFAQRKRARAITFDEAFTMERTLQ